MPLHDAFSSSQAVRMARLSTVPTTDDLRYLLAESKKHAKPVELPFENNRILFIVRVTLVGPTQTPRWTFQRGDGDSAKTLWTRESSEVLMIQNKIKIESAYEGHPGEGGPAQVGADSSTSTPIITSAPSQPQPNVMPISRRNFAGWPQAPVDESPPKVLVPPKPLPLAGFTAEFVASKESWPQLKDDAQKTETPESAVQNFAQVRSFARKTMDELIAPALNAGQQTVTKGSPESGKHNSPKPALDTNQSVAGKVDTADGTEKAGQKSKKPDDKQFVSIQLPPPVQFSDSLIDHVFNRLFDRNTGLMSFGTLVFFLLREFDRHQRKGDGLSIVICEVGLKRDGKVASLPFEALPAVAERIRSVCEPHHVAAHVSGNEFAILLDECDDTKLSAFCEALYKAVSAEAPLLDYLVPGSARIAIGAASIPNTCEDPGVLVAAAEMAKEMAKERKPTYLLFPSRSDVDG